MSDPKIDFIGDLQRVDVKAGDVFVLSTELRLSQDLAENMRKSLSDALGGSKVLILSDGIKLGVIRQEETA